MTGLQAALMRGRIREFQPEQKPVENAEPSIPVAQLQPSALPGISSGWEQAPQFVTVASIRRLVCREYQLTEAEMNSGQRGNKVIRPRHIAIYLATRLTTNSLPALGRLFGGRDHTTIMHARDRITAKRLVDPSLDAELAGMECRLTRQVA